MPAVKVAAHSGVLPVTACCSCRLATPTPPAAIAGIVLCSTSDAGGNGGALGRAPFLLPAKMLQRVPMGPLVEAKGDGGRGEVADPPA